jgi:hypothetical protein
MFKICFTPSHNLRPLIPTYKPREWTNRLRHRKQKGTTQVLAPIRHKKEIEDDISKKPISPEVHLNNPHYHSMKF